MTSAHWIAFLASLPLIPLSFAASWYGPAIRTWRNRP